MQSFNSRIFSVVATYRIRISSVCICLICNVLFRTGPARPEEMGWPGSARHKVSRNTPLPQGNLVVEHTPVNLMVPGLCKTRVDLGEIGVFSDTNGLSPYPRNLNSQIAIMFL